MADSILSAAWEGLATVFSWPNIIYPIAGTLLAMVFAFVPGLSGVTLMALAIPFTLGWDAEATLLLYGAFVGGATFMGSVTGILFNIPGKGTSAATLIDGYPLSQQGQAKTALACSATASAMGSTFGVFVLILLIPVMRRMVLLFGPPEFLMLAIWGLTTLGALTRGSVVKGLAVAAFGLLLGFVGYDPRTAELRYTFGSLYLHDGIQLPPVLLGLFALTEVIRLDVSGRKNIAGIESASGLQGSTREGILAVFRNFGLFLRCSVLGTVIGMVPGIGGSVASFLAYGHAVQSARDPERFGKGDIRGVLAPEAANDAKDGGALVPTLAFGIPGGTGTAVLLAVMTLHGLSGGQEMLTTRLSLSFVLVWSLFFSNILTSLIGLALVRPMARLTTIPVRFLTPVILLFVSVGAYIYRGRMGDVLVAYGAAVVGYFMRKYNWPRVPLIVALVLSRLFEESLQITLRLQELERIDFWRRPIVLILLVLSTVSLVWPLIRDWRQQWKRKHALP